MEILESANVKYESIKEQSNDFLVKSEDEREAQQAIRLRVSTGSDANTSSN